MSNKWHIYAAMLGCTALNRRWSDLAEAFHPGTNVLLEFIDDRGLVQSYKTVVHDVTQDSLLLQAPVEKKVPVRIPPGIELSLWQEQKESAYVAMAKVIDNRPGEVSLLVTTKPYSIEKVPRRRFFRIDADLPFRCGQTTGRVKNISGSGVLASVPAGTLKEGQTIEFELDLPGLSLPLRLEGKVVRVVGRGASQTAGIFFTLISEGMRDEIIRYVFQRQRELLRLGMLTKEELEKAD